MDNKEKVLIRYDFTKEEVDLLTQLILNSSFKGDIIDLVFNVKWKILNTKVDVGQT